ncbi:hypothetical protein TWF481_008336 [Arthrobotrys musiformis]|uniref:Uncharacterized protein n=1 Tax=Arthrobotrys musiformis TaxID=47236 RepID=A0AAV9W6U0_9PEZI
MRSGDVASKAVGLYLLAAIAHGAAIPNRESLHPEFELAKTTDLKPDGLEIPTSQHKLSKRSPVPQYPPGGSNDSSLDDIDPRGDRRGQHREEDEESNGPWDMFGNMSPGVLDDLRTHTNLVQNPPPQNMGLGMGLMVPRPVVANVGGGNIPQAPAQDEESGTEVEEEEKATTEIEEEEKEGSYAGTEIYEEEKAHTEIEEEEKEVTEIEEEENEVAENQDDNALRSSQHSQLTMGAGGQGFMLNQSPDDFLSNLQPNLATFQRRPSLFESPSVNSRRAPSSNGGRSRSSPTRTRRRVSGLFGGFDPSSFRDQDSGNNQLYGVNRNRRQSFSSPSSDLLEFGGNPFLSRFNSGDGPLMRPVTLNFGHESAYPQNLQNVQTNQVTEARDQLIRDDLLSQSLDDDFPPPRSAVSQVQRNDRPQRGTTLVDITGGLGGPPVYREEVKEESDSSGLDSDSA